MISDNIKEGDVVEGRITGIQSYGIFLRLNDECSGLIHATELEKLGRDNPTRFFKIGQPLKVKVLRVKPGGKQAVLRVHRGERTKGRLDAFHFETDSGFRSIKKQLEIWIEDAKNNNYI